jgi:hypothetical protein
VWYGASVTLCFGLTCWCVSCRRLDLHNNTLSGTIPSTLGNLTSLR